MKTTSRPYIFFVDLALSKLSSSMDAIALHSFHQSGVCVPFYFWPLYRKFDKIPIFYNFCTYFGFTVFSLKCRLIIYFLCCYIHMILFFLSVFPSGCFYHFHTSYLPFARSFHICQWLRSYGQLPLVFIKKVWKRQIGGRRKDF